LVRLNETRTSDPLRFVSELPTILGVLTPSHKLSAAFGVLWLLSSTQVDCRRGTRATALAQVTTPAPAPAGNPAIDFDSRVHDFGTVNEGSPLRHVFMVKNTGTSPLELTGVITSCGCTAATLGVQVIPPGKSGPIEVRFDTHGFQGVGSKTISVFSNDKQNPTSSLEIRYDVERLLGLDRVFVRLDTKRGAGTIERVWLTGKLAEQARPRVAKIEGGDKLVTVRTIESRRNGQTRRGLEIRLKEKKAVSGNGNITIDTGLPDPAQLVLGFAVAVN
jgi:hypothetical protein